MIDIQDLITTPFIAEIEHLDTKYHALKLQSLMDADKFDSTCNISTRQIQILIDNCEAISSRLKHYLETYKL